MAANLRREAVTAEKAAEIVRRPEKPRTKATEKNVKIPAELYERYFHKTDVRKIAEIIEAALEAWFAEKKGAESGADVLEKTSA